MLFFHIFKDLHPILSHVYDILIMQQRSPFSALQWCGPSHAAAVRSLLSWNGRLPRFICFYLCSQGSHFVLKSQNILKIHLHGNLLRLNSNDQNSPYGFIGRSENSVRNSSISSCWLKQRLSSISLCFARPFPASDSLFFWSSKILIFFSRERICPFWASIICARRSVKPGKCVIS